MKQVHLLLHLQITFLVHFVSLLYMIEKGAHIFFIFILHSGNRFGTPVQHTVHTTTKTVKSDRIFLRQQTGFPKVSHEIS